jgi:CRISPR-associated exonuclease Cas4
MSLGPLDWLLLFSGLVLVFAVYFRWKAGFRGGETLSRDDVTLRSERYGLVGRPDRIVKKGGRLVVEDKKSGTRLYDSHRAQMGVYLLLAEEHYGERPSHAVVVMGDGRREKIKNTKALRKKVLDTVASIREAREDLERELLANASPGKCRRCAQRSNCNQRAG